MKAKGFKKAAKTKKKAKETARSRAFLTVKWTQGPSHRATRDDSRNALCPPPDTGKLSLWRKLWATVTYVTSKCPVIRIPRKKTLMEKFKIKRFASGCDEIWDSRSTEGKDKLSTDPLTAILATLDPFYGIYWASSWKGRLQSPQPSHFSYC